MEDDLGDVQVNLRKMVAGGFQSHQMDLADILPLRQYFQVWEYCGCCQWFPQAPVAQDEYVSCYHMEAPFVGLRLSSTRIASKGIPRFKNPLNMTRLIRFHRASKRSWSGAGAKEDADR